MGRRRAPRPRQFAVQLSHTAQASRSPRLGGVGKGSQRMTGWEPPGVGIQDPTIVYFLFVHTGKLLMNGLPERRGT